MRSLARVVWHEGMHLAQHHFQAQSRYFEELGAFARSSLFFAPYGVTRLAFDEAALRNGSVSLLHATGLMPDGLEFHFPDEPLPEPRQIRPLFSPTQESHLLLLAIPAFLEGHANCAMDGAPAGNARFVATTETVRDENGGLDAKPVAFARKNYRLLLDVEDLSGMVTLPLARVRRDGAGNFVFDPEFVPPSLRTGASPRLVSLLEELLETLVARAGALAMDPADAASEVADFWLRNALHSALGPLLHLARSPRSHPSELFVELSRLAAALCTFSMVAHPRDLPLYDHDDLGGCFGALDRQIRRLLAIAAPVGSVRIPLRAERDALYTGTVAEPRCLTSSEWYLGIRSSLPAADLVARVPHLTKVCSAKHIERLAREAFPGLPITHVPSPPVQISPRRGTEYFSIPNEGPCWASIVETHAVGVYVHSDISDVELELVVAIDDPRGG